MIVRILENWLRDILILIGSVYVKFSLTNRLSDGIQSSERALSLNRCELQKVGRLADRKIRILDIGARGGPMSYLNSYESLTEFWLCEPEPQEAERLKAKGYNVIERVIDEHTGEVTLIIAKDPGNSSVMEPCGSILPFYAGESDRFQIVKRHKLLAWSLKDTARHMGGASDLIKMDTQGAELRILRGMGSERPIFVISEFLTAELYKGQPTLFDIGQFLFQQGYLVFDMPTKKFRPPWVEAMRPKGVRASLGLPLLGDAYFMPDWTRSEGLALIKGRERIWAALMVIHGLEDVLRYVLDQSIITDSSEILSSLDQ